MTQLAFEPGAGHAILEVLFRLEEKLAALETAHAEHVARDERRLRLIDSFIDPSWNLQGALKLLNEHTREFRCEATALRGDMASLELAVSRHMRTALELAEGDPARVSGVGG